MAFADPLPAIKTWLVADPALLALLPSSAAVASRTPVPLVLPFVRFTRIGGGGHRHGRYGVDPVRLQIDTFADWQREDLAMAVHLAVRYRLLSLCGAAYWRNEVHLGCPEELSGPTQGWDETHKPPLAWVRSDWRIHAET